MVTLLDTLTAIIQEHIEEGAAILSDGWRAYAQLNTLVMSIT